MSSYFSSFERYLRRLNEVLRFDGSVCLETLGFCRPVFCVTGFGHWTTRYVRLSFVLRLLQSLLVVPGPFFHTFLRLELELSELCIVLQFRLKDKAVHVVSLIALLSCHNRWVHFFVVWQVLTSEPDRKSVV